MCLWRDKEISNPYVSYFDIYQFTSIHLENTRLSVHMYLDRELSREQAQPLFIFCNNHNLRCDTYPAFELFDKLRALKLYQANELSFD